MKAIRWIACISAAIAVVIIILAGISLISGRLIIHGIEHGVNYFHIANSFLLLAIALFIVTKHCCTCCSDEKEEKKEGQ
jgi:hypothetical protein